MRLSRRCAYALRAVLELTLRGSDTPSRIADIAASQHIPRRFLEAILNQLRHAGVVESRRGAEGGYLLADRPEQITVGRVIRSIEGPIGPVGCVTGEACCPTAERCAFRPAWERARDALLEVYDSTTFADIRAEAMCPSRDGQWCYSI